MAPSDTVPDTVPDTVLAAIARLGPVPFSDFMDAALYGPRGFYEAGGGAGRRRDFLTSPEVGGLFGALIANHLDAQWEVLGRPDPFLVVEAGAGPATLARTVLAATPRCAPALRYLLVERALGMRAHHAEHLRLVAAEQLMGVMTGHRDDPDEGLRVAPGQGPRVASVAHLPAEPFRGVILANEMLDNVAFDLLQRHDGGWAEVRVGAGHDGVLGEVLVPAEPFRAAWADTHAPGAVPGARIPVQHRGAQWVADALALLEAGTLTVIDYAAPTTAGLAARPWTQWLRTYRSHGRGGHPLRHPGSQDLTVEVAVDQLPKPTRVRSQAEALSSWGLALEVERARSLWHERAAIGDLEALMARSRVQEADALTDPTGLGAFSVLEWDVALRRSGRPTEVAR